jgi:hypothetical protein
MTAVHITATAELARSFGVRLVERGRGGLVLLGSIVARQGLPLQAHYAATKACVHALAEALAVELRPAGVDVLLVAPGPVESGFADAAGMRMGSALPAREVPGEVLAALGRRRTVVPGRQAKLLTAGLSTMPRAMRTRVMHGVMASRMSATGPGPGAPTSPETRPPRGVDLAEACVREALSVIERSGVEALSAAAHPLAYRLMFGTPLPDPAGHPATAAAARRAFGAVRAAVSRLHGTATDEEIDTEAVLAWAKVHGLATLPRVPVVAALGLSPGVLAAATDPAGRRVARELSPPRDHRQRSARPVTGGTGDAPPGGRRARVTGPRAA